MCIIPDILLGVIRLHGRGIDHIAELFIGHPVVIAEALIRPHDAGFFTLHQHHVGDRVEDLLIAGFTFTDGQFCLFAFSDVLIGTIPADDLAVLITLDVDAHEDVAQASVGEEDAMFYLRFEMPFRCGKGFSNFRADHGRIFWVDEAFRVFGRGHLVTADRFHIRAEDGVEVVVEGEGVLLEVVFPVTEAGDLERFSQTCFVLLDFLTLRFRISEQTLSLNYSGNLFSKCQILLDGGLIEIPL